MKTTPRTDVEAKRLSERKPLPVGWRDATIISAVERPSKKGNETIELELLVVDGEGDERTMRDWLSDAALASQKLRHCCEACGDDVFAKYEAGSVGSSDFPGYTVRIRFTVDKIRGKSSFNSVCDYARIVVAEVA
jgi:hypothetical protein